MFQYVSKREQAEKAVESTKSAMMSAKKAIIDLRRSSLSQQEPREGVAAAQSKLDLAIKTLESIKRQDDLIYKFIKKTGKP